MSKPIKRRIKDIKKENIYNKKERIFYVCSYGGSGSKMLCRYLQSFGKAVHIHSRQPPSLLEEVGHCDNREWFNGKHIPLDKIKNYTVIYIYRNPIKAIFSRHRHLNNKSCVKGNLKNIQVQLKYLTINHNKFLESGRDLYGLEEFFNNYVIQDFNRNYDIYCIKYEEFFENISVFNKRLNIPDIKHKYPKCVEKNRQSSINERIKLGKIYSFLNNKMKDMPFIYINKANPI